MGKNRTGKLVFNHVKEHTPFPGAWVTTEHQHEKAHCTITQSSRLWAKSETKKQT